MSTWTSIYLEEADRLRLRRLAEREGRSQAQVIRDAIATYEAQQVPDRNFALTGAGRGDGRSVADIEDELMEGFGED